MTSKDQVKDFKYWITDKNFDFGIVYFIEKAILVECDFQLYTDTPNDIMNFILKKFSHLQKIEQFKDKTTYWINFALSRYEIFSKYDYATITLACCLLTISNETPENHTQEEVEVISKEFRDFLIEQNIFDKALVNTCQREILDYLQRSEETNESETEKESEESEEEFLETTLSQANSSDFLNDFVRSSEQYFLPETLCQKLDGETNQIIYKKELSFQDSSLNSTPSTFLGYKRKKDFF